ncbi:MAG: hypothetical protein AAB703_06460, partial [Pseudomonadota bacterium]
PAFNKEQREGLARVSDNIATNEKGDATLFSLSTNGWGREKNNRCQTPLLQGPGFFVVIYFGYVFAS